MTDEAEAGSDFDLMPYLSLPLTYSQPGLIAALGVLHGLEPPRVETARVLELGCASGGNIVPLAARFPRGRFVGLDMSRKHVDEGMRRVAALGLANIEIRQADIGAAGLSGEAFDYVIAHGVLSWVARPVQSAIFAICRDHLSPAGMAVISYNVLPGWHLRNVVRQLFLHHAGTSGTPQERVERARAALREVAEAADEAEPYGHLVRKEAARLASRPASYILGEYLVPENDPCSFRDFTMRAAAHDLAWLCEADLPSSAPERCAPKAAERIRALAGPDPLAVQEYTDLFTGRTFRRSVLVRAAHAARSGTPADAALLGLHVTSASRLAQRLDGASGGSMLADRRGRAGAVQLPVPARVLAVLSACHPSTVPLADLVERVAEDPQEAQQVRSAVLELAAAGRAFMSTTPVHCGRASTARPSVWAPARHEAAAGQPWATSLTHGEVALAPPIRTLLPLIDGTRDRAALVAAALSAHGQGRLDLRPAGNAPPDEPLRTRATRLVEDMLTFLEASALLDGD